MINKLSPRFKKIFLIRFIAYFLLFIVTFALTVQFGPLIQAEITYRKDKLFGIKHRIADNQTQSAKSEGFAQLLNFTPVAIVPVSTEYGIVIEKINANARVIPNVDPTNEVEYMQALTKGVAAANISTLPGEPGNLYIFSHSTDAPWNVARYNAIFYLLRELEPGDRVIIFYKHKRYDYIVYDKKVVPPTDVSYLLNRYDQPVLTLQTCDPPGTTINRLIVRAKLAGY